jgi:hypothetical protein
MKPITKDHIPSKFLFVLEMYNILDEFLVEANKFDKFWRKKAYETDSFKEFIQLSLQFFETKRGFFYWVNVSYQHESTLVIFPFKFHSWTCVLRLARYRNGQRAIELIDPFTGESIAVATVCLVDETTEFDEVFIKDYSENEGMTKTLIYAGIIKPEVIKVVESGFVSISKYKLTYKALNAF